MNESDENIKILRGVFVKDMTSFGIIPTIQGVILASNGNSGLGAALVNDALFAWCCAGKIYEELLEYLMGPMQMDKGQAKLILKYFKIAVTIINDLKSRKIEKQMAIELISKKVIIGDLSNSIKLVNWAIQRYSDKKLTTIDFNIPRGWWPF